MDDQKEQKSTELIFRSWGHNIGNTVSVVQDLVALIKYELSGPSPNLDAITKDLDMISKLNLALADAPLPFNIEKIFINLLIQELVKRIQLRLRYKNKNVKFSVVLDGEPCVAANSVWLAEVFNELFNNAINAMSDIENKEIRIISRISGDNLTIFVSDNGKGIEREQFANILKDPPILKTDGKGRGLYIVRLTIELYGGHINIDTSSNGTTIAICLPICN